MKTFLTGAAVALVMAVPAIAQTAASAPMAPHMRGMNRVELRTEVTTKVATHFAKMDLNHDGFVTTTEAQEAGKQMHAMRGAKMAERMEKNSPKAFARIDANHDGNINQNEFAQARDMRAGRMAKGDHAGGMHHRGMGMGGMMAMADANKDGRVSLQEATTAAVRHFDMADTNHDGQLTPDERRAMHAGMNRGN